MLKKEHISILLGLLVLIVYLTGAYFIPLMDIDASQYGSISMEMLQDGHYLEVHHKHKDYLDKPPLLFWAASLFYQIFGISHFSFRIPSILSTLLGLWSTYRLGTFLYNKKTGILAAAILMSCQAWFLIQHDVRTDTMLANMTIFALWQLYAYLKHKEKANLRLGFLGIGLAMLQKGPIGLMVPVLALGSYLIAKKDWKSIFQWSWLEGLPIIALLLAPMLYGLYTQFGWEGWEFYFWTQSFGRLTGENVWKDNSGYTYFIHTFLWSFLPWSLLFLYAFTQKAYRSISQKGISEYLTIGGFTLTFIALSFSHYKLPHYIFVVYPLAAIIAASELNYLLDNKKQKALNSFKWIHLFFSCLIWIAIAIIFFKIFTPTIPIIILAIIGLISTFYAFIKINKIQYNIILTPLIAITFGNLIMNTHFYPKLSQYHSGYQAGLYVKENRIPQDNLYFFNIGSHAFDFYNQKIIPILNDTDINELKNTNDSLWVFTTEQGKQQILNQDFQLINSVNFPHYHITKLSWPFLNKETRANKIKYRYLLQLKAK